MKLELINFNANSNDVVQLLHMEVLHIKVNLNHLQLVMVLATYSVASCKVVRLQLLHLLLKNHNNIKVFLRILLKDQD